MSRKTMRRLACMKMRGWLPGLALSVAVCAAPVIAAPPSSWPLFRGDHRQTGRANSVVPEQPVLLWAIRGSSADRTSADSISSQSLAAGIESTAAVFDGMVYSGGQTRMVFDRGSIEPNVGRRRGGEGDVLGGD